MPKGKKRVREAICSKPKERKRTRIREGEKKTDRSRPDRAQRQTEKRELEHFVVKASFPGRVGGDEFVKGAILDVVDNFVERISKMTVQGCLLANEFIVESFLRDLPLPDLDQTFFRRCMTANGESMPLLQEIIDTRFQDHPHISPDGGVRDMLSYASVTLETAFGNNIWMNFARRMIVYVREWCAQHETDLPDVITSVILGFPIRTRYVFKRHVYAFIEETWNRLFQWWPGGDLTPRLYHLKILSEAWAASKEHDPQVVSMLVVDPHANHTLMDIKEVRDYVKAKRKDYLNNPRMTFYPESQKTTVMLLQMCHILQWRLLQGKVDGGFLLVPLFKVKRHHIQINSGGVYDILRAVSRKVGTNRFPPDVRAILEMRTKDVRPCHDPHRSVLWNYFFRTSGVHARGVFANVITTDGISVSIHYDRPKQGEASSQTRNVHAPIPAPGERAIFVDPGRIHMFTGYELLQDGTKRFYSFSRKTYYSALKPSLEKMARWDNQLMEVYREMSHGSLKTLDWNRRSIYIRAYLSRFERLWTIKIQKKIARERFYLASKKRSVLDSFFASFMKDDPRRPKIYYGASSVASHGKGELAVPVKNMYETCKRFYTTFKVNEHLTTRCHSAEECGHARMHNVKNKGSEKAIHGVLWCPGCKKLVNRDRDAAVSIGDAAMSGQRPVYLAFDRPFEYRKVLTLLPRKKGRSRKQA